MNPIQRLFKPAAVTGTLALFALLAAQTAMAAANVPTVTNESPDAGASDVPTSLNSSQNLRSGTSVSVTFSETMNQFSIDSANAPLTFTLKETNGNIVPGVVTMNPAHTVATFTPSWAALTRDTMYTATVSKSARSAGGVPLSVPVEWSFTTDKIASVGQMPVSLGTSAKFVILGKAGISNVPHSKVTGDIGVSPIAHTAITGFSETADAGNTMSSSAQVLGKIYAADYAAPTPAYMTTAIGDMERAYTDAAGRSIPNSTELGAGHIGGLTLAPGLYKWSSNVLISTNLTLKGSASDVWIFQVAGNLTEANGAKIILSGGALAKNVFWQSAGATSIGTTAVFEGILLQKTLIAVRTGATVNGRLLSQTAVTLEQNVVTQPAP